MNGDRRRYGRTIRNVGHSAVEEEYSWKQVRGPCSSLLRVLIDCHRMEAALAEMALEEVGKDLDDDIDFINEKGAY